MLLDVKCSLISSIAVDLTFDNGIKKKEVIAMGDLICVDYNNNGRINHFEGIVISIRAASQDPKAWSIILDGSGDFESKQARFSPTQILDLVMVRKANTAKYIESPMGENGILGLRVVKGRLQYTKNGYDWYPVRLSPRDIVDIKPEEGTVPEHHHCPMDGSNEDDEIKDETM